MSIFKTIRNEVNMISVMEHYSVSVKRSNLINCIFHNDKHPSMKLYKDHYHCFSCGAHGDVISFTAQLLGLSSYEAAQRLATDFGIEISTMQKAKIKKSLSVYEARTLLREYISILEEMRDKYCPASPKEEWHPIFCDSVRQLPIYQYYYELLSFGSYEEQKQFVKQERRFFNELQTKLRHTRMAV